MGMATYPNNNLGKLSTGDQRPVEINNGSLNIYEIVPGEFTQAINSTDLSLDTFTTNLMGNPTPVICTGMVSWISESPGGLPVQHGISGGQVHTSTSGKLNLNWALSTDPANVTTTVNGNVVYNVDYILDYGNVQTGTSNTYYLNISYCEEDCLSNISNCNVSVPTENIYTGSCPSQVTTWQGIQTLGSQHCGSYNGELNENSVVTTGNVTVWNNTINVYYPYGSKSSQLELQADQTLSYEFDFSSVGFGIYEGSIFSKNLADTYNSIMWISETAGGDPVVTTNGCEAKKIVSALGAQFNIKKGGNLYNRDIDLNQLSVQKLFLNIQPLDINGGIATTNKILQITFQEVTEDGVLNDYNAPLSSRKEVIPVGIASGLNTIFKFPESGEYLISAHYTDSTGAIFQQSKYVDIDLENSPNKMLDVPTRYPNFDANQTLTRGFLGYGPQYQCEPGRYANSPKYVTIGSKFTYNGQNYNMTQNMAGCLVFNCLDHCLGTNITGDGPNGILSRGTIDNCQSEYYGTTQQSNNIINWASSGFTDTFNSVNADILTYPVVIPNKSTSRTSTVHGTLESKGTNILMWISTEPGGGPHGCYGFLGSQGNYYSLNGQLKFYATYTNGVVEKFSKSHAQLEMNHTYYINIAKISGNIQDFLNGKSLKFVPNKNLTVNFTGLSAWNFKDTGRVSSPAAGINVSPIVDGTTSSNTSIGSEIMPESYSVDENYGICAETWDSEQTDSIPVRVPPLSRVAMPFTTTTRMHKGSFVFTTNTKGFAPETSVLAYIVDAPEKTRDAAYSKIVRGKQNAQGGMDLGFDLEIEVDNYTASRSSDAVLQKFTTYYLVLENNTINTLTATRLMSMVYNSSYGLPNTNYDLYPPWCINSEKINVGGAPNASDTGNYYFSAQNSLGGDLNCGFTDNQTFNYYELGQRFTIRGKDIICNAVIANCLSEKPNATIQDVLMCAGVYHDSLNPDTPMFYALNNGRTAKNSDNQLNTNSPDSEAQTFTSGSGLNLFDSNKNSGLALTGGATYVDQSVRDAINNSDFSEFNLNGLKNNAFTGNTSSINWQDYLSQFEKSGNYTSFSNYPLTGDQDLMPSSFKIRKRKVKNPNIYGVDIPLKDGRFVNATNQRITGGTVKKLAQPVKIIPRIPRALKTFDVRDEAYGKVIPSNINQTYRNTYYNPRSIGAYFSTKGRQIQNIAQSGFITDPRPISVPGGGFISSSGANESIPSNKPPLNPNANNTSSGEDYYLPDEFQPQATDIYYASAPVMTMTPLKIDENGNYVPAGPAAPVDIRQPTPSATITSLAAASVAEGTELFINEGKIVFKYGGSLESIKTQVNCGKLGVNAIIAKDEEIGSNVLIISSCDSSPWTVANGCGGGIFQQVGDFHINRGFDQNKSITSVFVPQSQLISGSSGSESVIAIPYTDRNFPATGRLVDINFDKVKYESSPLNHLDFKVPNTNSIMMPQETITFSTAGTGYKVGDRLRLVGGTPINSNKGPLTVICIESAGSGYVDPAKLTIRIGDGTTPGIGASAVVSSLDMNGGIAAIEMLNYGVGYDPARPPKISIIDNHSDAAYNNILPVNGLNQFEVVTFPVDTIIRFDYPQITKSSDSVVEESHIQVTQTFYRATSGSQDTEFEIGGKNQTNNCAIYYGGKTVDGNYPSINIDKGQIYGNLDHKPYKAVIGLPKDFSVIRGQYIRLSSSGTGKNASIVNKLPDLLCSDHMIGKDGSGNDVVAYNMPIVRHRVFLNAETIDAIAAEMAALDENNESRVTVTVAKPFIVVNDGSFKPVAPVGIPRIDAELSALIGVNPEKISEEGINPVDPLVGGYASLAGPLRVAKFLVTAVDAVGGIAGLKLLDRGLYRVFPSDLTFGIPLEYDYVLQGVPFSGTENDGSVQAPALGGVDPINDNILYGGYHPEYWKPGSEGNSSGDPRQPFQKAMGGVKGAKHPNWFRASEYKQVNTATGDSEYIEYYGTPGAYDPSTLVQLKDGSRVLKVLEFDFDGEGQPENVRDPEIISGGQGARVFLTAQDVPDCSEEGTAQQDLGLPDVVRDLDGPKSFVQAANTGLIDVGYLPTDIKWEVDGEGDPANVTLNSIYPGIRFNGLDWFGLPSDDYAVGALCIQATLSSPNLTISQQQDELEKIYQSSDAFGVTQDTFSLPQTITSPVNNSSSNLNAAVLSLLCIDSIQTDPNSVFGDGPVAATIKELYKYDISNIFGQEVKLNGSKQEVDAFVFQSKRFSNLDQIDLVDYLENISEKSQAYIDTPDKIWVDSVTLDKSNVDIDLQYPGFKQGGWGYFENNIMTRYQTPLVDTRFIHNSIVYDPQTGARTADLYTWDPFKGVLPGFIDKEIDYITEKDPVVYNAQRHQFGKNQIGAVWWDTSTIRYQWYEQGTNVERWKNWGKAFPGSTIIVCEWVESRAKPENYNGDGTPRWTDQYITERRWDPVKQEYSFFYYYWVSNRTTVDARLRETRNRKYDTRTIARYLSDPVGFGIHMISFLSSNAVMVSNLSDVLRDSGNHVQINLSRDLDPDGIKHTAWKLIREDDENSTIPENITLKLTDSLAAENLVGEVVPDPSLSKVMSYGAGFRPRQSMFVDVKEARRTMAYVLNEIFANLKLYTDFPSWDDAFPQTDTWQYIERVNYFATIYVDENSNEPVRYDDSYKPIFNVSTISDLNSLRDLPDGTVVQVAGTELAQPQLWIYNLESENFSQIAILNDTIRFKDTVYTQDTNSQMSLEIRSVLNLFNNDLFQRFNFWNILFFEMLKYAYMEQRQLDWAFKTTYLYVEKEEEDLIQISGFKPDNYQAILDYMDEAKPYTSKIREYRDGKSPPRENIGTIQPSDGIPGDGDYDDIDSGVPGIPGLPGPGEGPGDGPPTDINPNAGLRSVSDYDKPPYPDPQTESIRILDDFNQNDREIMATNGDYINYFRADNKANDPIRHNKLNLTYDRTNWRFTEYLWNSNTTSLEQSITNNIVNLSAQTVKQVSANADVRAIDRIFKFDPVVINQFNLDIENNYGIFDTTINYAANSYVRRVNDVFTSEFDLYKSNKAVSAQTGFKATDWDLQEAPYSAITTNVNVVYDIVSSGNLNFTLALLKNKVGGGWQGETLDADVFTKVVPGADPTYDYQTQFGYGSQDYEQFYWDVVQEVNNYVGIFKQPPDVNLRRNDRDYDGFDGVSFLKVLYGEERPEELVQVDPYETFIVNCVTNTQTAKIPIGFADSYTDPNTGNIVSGRNGNIVVTGGEITQVNLSQDLIKRSFGTCRAVDLYAEDSGNTGSNASFRVNLQAAPDGWPGSQSWPQIGNVEITQAGTGYDANTTTVWMTVALNKNANPVQFQIFESLFGQTDYGRIRNTTTLKEDLMSWDEEIVLENPDIAPDPLPGVPGYIWLNGSELIKYARKNPTTGALTQIQRGAEGTTIQDWKVSDNVKVWDGTPASKFNNLNPQKSVWLDQGFRYDALYNWDDNNYNDSDVPGNTYIIYDEANANIMYAESNIDVIVSEILGANTGTGFQPGWDYGNIISQTCNVSGIQFLEPGKARFTLDCDIPQLVNFCQITTDFSTGELDFVIDETPLASVIVLEDPLTNTSIIAEQLAGNGNVVTNIMLVPVGNQRYSADATVRSNVFVTGTATGNISITESYVPVLEPNANITAIADISGQNVFSVANTINSMSLPTVSAQVDEVWQSGVKRNFLRISGRYFTISEIDTPTLHIDPGTYLSEWFEYTKQRNNTIIIEDDLWTSETLVEGMSNTLITFNIDLNNIPWDHGNAVGFPALSLADLGNTDSADAYSIMKFLHGLEPPPTE